MRVAVIGATGLIGSAVAAHLSSRGYSVVSMSRSVPGGSPNAVAVDISEADSSSYWIPHLQGVDAIINCAGCFKTARMIRRPWFII
jgi:nucleoside-diphosphate-sugar epimerase